MEENVALDSTKQKKFDKSIKGIKKLIKKKDAESKLKGDKTDKVKTGRVGKKKRPQRGLVYLSHIPHGFYENEMSQYFKQFGVVTNARVIKSKKTGRSKGHAFVEFKEPAVAEIVAETMNNYLMGKRLIKAAYVPPEKQRRKVFRKHWNALNNPGNNLRIKMKKAHNENKDEEGELQRARKLFTNINKTKKKLRELGVDYDFFTPVDVPEALIKKVQVQNKNMDSKENINEIKSKNKGKKVDQVNVNVKKESPRDITVKSKSPDDTEVKNEQTKTKITKNKKLQEIKADNITQKKKQNLKDKGVTPIMEDFIKVTRESDNESDSSLEFDSDEYEKMLEDDDVDSETLGDDSDEDGSGSDEEGSGSDEDDFASDGAENDVSDEPPRQKGNNKSAAKVTLPLTQMKSNVGKKGAQKKPQPQLQQAKRKAPQKPPVVAAPKKPKFQKHSNQKPINKQFKKKK